MVYKVTRKVEETKHEFRAASRKRRAARRAAKAAEPQKPQMDFIVGGERAENVRKWAKRQAQLEKIAKVRYLTDKEAKELRKLDLLLGVEPYLADIFHEMAEESEKYAQYIKDVPEWAKQ